MLSFADAKERFSDFFPEITEEMIENGETTEALNKKFSGNVDLQHKFEKFVEECKQNNFFGNTKSSKQGVVVMAGGINYFEYLYEGDIVI